MAEHRGAELRTRVEVDLPGELSVTELERVAHAGSRLVRLSLADPTTALIPQQGVRVAQLRYGSPMDLVLIISTATSATVLTLNSLALVAQRLSQTYANLGAGKLSRAQTDLTQAQTEQTRAQTDLTRAQTELTRAQTEQARRDLDSPTSAPPSEAGVRRRGEPRGDELEALEVEQLRRQLDTELRRRKIDPRERTALAQLRRTIQAERETVPDSELTATEKALLRLTRYGWQLTPLDPPR